MFPRKSPFSQSEQTAPFQIPIDLGLLRQSDPSETALVKGINRWMLEINDCLAQMESGQMPDYEDSLQRLDRVQHEMETVLSSLR